MAMNAIDEEVEVEGLEGLDEHYELRQSRRGSPSSTHKGHFEFELAGTGEMELLGIDHTTEGVAADDNEGEEEAGAVETISDNASTVHRDQPGGGGGGGGSTRPSTPHAHGFVQRVRYSLFGAPTEKGKKRKIGVFAATSICGNDITSSVFYVAGITAFYSGVWAPICLLLGSGLFLYFFRFIYSEVVMALPVNGGTYTVLMNTTKKAFACWAVCFSIISYVATAVVSAHVAITYIQNLLPQIEAVWGTFILLLLFAILNLIGLRESANVASTIFAFHMTVMVILFFDCLIWAIQDGFHLLKHNYDTRNDFVQVEGQTVDKPGMPIALLWGFSSALLGITGFETSANFVEEQEKGIYASTVRNMWYIVAFLNPVFSLLSLSVLELPEVMGYPLDNGSPQNDDLLIKMARHEWVGKIVSFDAFLVLSGAVLTSYVGIIGLMRRLVLDRCLPEFLLQKNKTFGTYHLIIFSFLAICTSLYYITKGDVYTLANVYTIAFLSVMTLFAVGNLILKYNRARLKRVVRAPVSYCLLGIAGTITGIIGNIILNVSVVQYFVVYYFITLAVIFFTYNRMRILKIMLHILLQYYPDHGLQLEDLKGIRGALVRKIVSWRRTLGKEPMIYFIKDRNIRLMTKVILYLLENEQCVNLKFVHIFRPDYSAAKSRMVYGMTPAPSLEGIPEEVENEASGGVTGGAQQPRRRFLNVPLSLTSRMTRPHPVRARPSGGAHEQSTIVTMPMTETIVENDVEGPPPPAPLVRVSSEPQTSITAPTSAAPTAASASANQRQFEIDIDNLLGETDVDEEMSSSETPPGSPLPATTAPARSPTTGRKRAHPEMGSIRALHHTGSDRESYVDFRHAVEEFHPDLETMREDVETLQRIFITLKLDLVGICTNLPFDRRLIAKINKKLGVPPNLMFISCPGERFPLNVAELGGVRVITATA